MELFRGGEGSSIGSSSGRKSEIVTSPLETISTESAVCTADNAALFLEEGRPRARPLAPLPPRFRPRLPPRPGLCFMLLMVGEDNGGDATEMDGTGVNGTEFGEDIGGENDCGGNGD